MSKNEKKLQRMTLGKNTASLQPVCLNRVDVHIAGKRFFAYTAQRWNFWLNRKASLWGQGGEYTDCGAMLRQVVRRLQAALSLGRMGSNKIEIKEWICGVNPLGQVCEKKSQICICSAYIHAQHWFTSSCIGLKRKRYLTFCLTTANIFKCTPVAISNS